MGSRDWEYRVGAGVGREQGVGEESEQAMGIAGGSGRARGWRRWWDGVRFGG